MACFMSYRVLEGLCYIYVMSCFGSLERIGPGSQLKSGVGAAADQCLQGLRVRALVLSQNKAKPCKI